MLLLVAACGLQEGIPQVVLADHASPYEETLAARQKVTFRGREGRPAELITDQATPDPLLVMGVSDGGLKQLAPGSVTEKVLRQAHGPLLQIPDSR